MRPIILFIQRLGRLGGLLVGALGLLSVVLGGRFLIDLGPWNGAEVWSPAGLALGLAHVGTGVALAGWGLSLLWNGAPPDFRLSDEALRALLSESRPMILCLECRTEIVAPPCAHCGQSSTAFDVRSPTDAENARALLGLEGKIELR